MFVRPGIAVLALTACSSPPLQMDSSNPTGTPGDFECAARPARFDHREYRLDGVPRIEGAADVLTASPTKVWSAGAGFDLMRSPDDKHFIRLLFESEKPPSREVNVVVQEAGEQGGVRVGEFTRVQRIPFVITIDEAGATLLSLDTKELSLRMTDFRPAVARAACFSGTAVFDGLAFPIIETKETN